LRADKVLRDLVLPEDREVKSLIHERVRRVYKRSNWR
jgi:hypothetical protein